MPTCYSKEDWVRFAKYEVDFVTEAKMHVHLMHCASCRAIVKEIIEDLRKEVQHA